MLSLPPLSPSRAQALSSLRSAAFYRRLATRATYSGPEVFFLTYDLQEIGAVFLLRYPVYRMGVPHPVQPVYTPHSPQARPCSALLAPQSSREEPCERAPPRPSG
jgi:hypothetical protein